MRTKTPPSLVAMLVVLLALMSSVQAGAQSASATIIEGQTGPGSLYGLAKPAVWNGDLVVYAHGIVDPGAPVGLPTEAPSFTALRDGWLAAGFGVAYSSYDANGYALKDGVQRTHQLKALFTSKFGPPQRTFLVGHSLGGLVVLMLAERYPDQYDGVLPACGVVGGTPLEIDYIGNARLLIDFLFPAVADAVGTTFAVKPNLDVSFSSPLSQFLLGQFAAGFSPTSQPLPFPTVALANAGQLPGRDVILSQPDIAVGSAYGVVNFAVRFTDNILNLVNGKMPFDNMGTVYETGLGPQADALINSSDGVARYASEPSAVNYLAHYYSPTGAARIPTLTMHNLYDPVVPLFHETEFKRLVDANGSADLVAQWTVPSFGHCNFTAQQNAQAFQALVTWVYTGQRPPSGVIQ